jgi:hypothetical protein
MKQTPGFTSLEIFRPGCIKRCQVVVKVNIMSNDLIGGYLTFYLNQPIKWTDFRLEALLADTILTKLYTTGLWFSDGVFCYLLCRLGCILHTKNETNI